MMNNFDELAKNIIKGFGKKPDSMNVHFVSNEIRIWMEDHGRYKHQLIRAYERLSHRIDFCKEEKYGASEDYINGLLDAKKILEMIEPLLKIIKLD